ncbi:MAG: DNA polymerase III subunit beta [Proteobacteria bacterium]|nr:DNA polymerase III subunit beta [Pseudomonadota bacterium]
MKFSLDRDRLARVLKRVDGVCPIRGSFQILSCCMIEAKGKTIRVTGTDYDNTLRVTEEADIIEEGTVLINSQRLLSTVQNLVKDAEVTVASEGPMILIKCGNFAARIPANDLSEYPGVPEWEVKPTLAMNAVEFRKLIDKTIFSISADDTRAEFTGAFMTITESGRIQMVSTDGHRLSRAESTVNINGVLPSPFVSGVVIHKKGLTELQKNINELQKNIDCADVYFDVDDSKFGVRLGDNTFYISLINGSFPDFSKVIPQNLEHRAILNREAFQQIVRRASIFTAKTGTIRVALTLNRLEITSDDQKTTSSMKDYMDVDYAEGVFVEAGFNWRYIDQILSVIDCDDVSLEILDSDSPAVIRDVSSDKVDFIIMPMQL